jgi:type I restriction enzyme, S subunit
MMNKHTAVLLETHFDTAFAAPNGIQKLRELILTLAMQGKLVPQDPNDPPASELLKEIEAEKKRLVKEGKIKAPKPLPLVTEEEKPYALPEGWEWVRIRNICHDWGQKTPDSRFTYIDVGSIDNKAGLIGKDVQVLEACDAPSRARKLVHKGTVIYSTVRPYLLNIAIVENEYEQEAIASTAFAILHPFSGVCDRFVYSYLRSSNFIKYVENTMKGVAYPAINDGDFFQAVFPLPPLPEQQRIVAKIDELMTRCDALEKLRTQREEKQLAVHAAAITQLLSIAQTDEHPRAQAFLAKHFGELYTVKKNVAELRKAILQLAVMGKLVPQDPNDPPASELLKEIEAEKKRLVKEGKIKILKPLPEIKPEEIPCALPLGWAWARLQDVLDVRDGTHDSPRDAIGPNTYPLITSKNFVNGGVDFANARQISAEDHFEIIKRSRVERFDILFSMIGGNIGNQIIVEEDREFSIKNVALFKYYNKTFTHPYFIKRFMEHLAIDLQQQAAGGAQPFVSLGFLRNLVIGLPPQLEQQRIVSKIDQLMGLCDTLEQRIAAATCKQTELLNAVMAEV